MKKFKLSFLSCSIIFLTACGGGDGGTSDYYNNETPTTPTTPTTPNEPENKAPVAAAGINQNVTLGDLVVLDGSKSLDEDQNLLTYTWVIKEKPLISNVNLSNSSIVNPTFKPDVVGKYVVSLIVNDGKLDSSEDTIEINVVKGNAAPVAAISQVPETIQVGNKVIFDGSSSTDSDNDAINYIWTIESKPTDSTAQLSMATTVNPSVIFDKIGTYTIGLVVSDGDLSSEKVTSTIQVVRGNSAPLADAGTAQTIQLGQIVALDGSKSNDPDNDQLSYKWAVSSKPNGSNALISNTTNIKPTFTPDVAGNYVINLIVSDGALTASSNVNITVQTAPELVLSTSDFFGSTVHKLPYSSTASFNNTYNCIGTGCTGPSLASFNLEAKGRPYTIINLNATSNNPTYSAFFGNLTNNQIIQNGENVKFDLKATPTQGNTVTFYYSFTVKETGQTFSYTATGRIN